MRARDYFEAVRGVEREMRRRIWAVEAAESVLYGAGGAGGAGRQGGGADPSWRVCDRITAYDTALRAYEASVDELVDAEHEAYTYIRMLDGQGVDDMRDALQLRYVCLLDDGEVAGRMGCSRQTLRRWVAQAFAWYDDRRVFERIPPRYL